jgi:LysR family transcriptional regulator, nitrogen assimilation regulatory protein
MVPATARGSLSAALAMIESRWVLFIKVVELGSLTHAASVLNTTQSAISRQIAMLERECRDRLFRRTGRGVVLTDFGKRIYPRVKALTAQADQLAEDIRASSGKPLGEVRLGLLPFTVSRLAGTLYRAAAERFPDVRLHMTEGSSVQLEEWLNQGRLDLSQLLREGDAKNPGEVTLRRIPLCLVGPAGDPALHTGTIRFEEVVRLPLVLPAEPHLMRARLMSLAARRRVTLNVAVEADSTQLQRQIVTAGGGYAIMVAMAVLASERDRFSLARIIEPELWRRVILSKTTLRPDTSAARAVAKLVLELDAAIDLKPPVP